MFSVIIPLYNKQDSIKNTLNSVLNQTVQSFEILVVNDGSTDNSLAKAKEIKDPRIRVINKENGGVSSARNTGIEQAAYDWIAFLDGDDLWENDHLEEVLRMMKQYPEENVFVTSFKYSDKRAIYKHKRDSEIFRVENYFKDAIQEPLICTIIIVINKDCFQKTGMFNVTINRGEDLDLWARIARHFSIIKSEKVTAIYKVDAENKLTTTKSVYSKSVLSLVKLGDLSGYERKYFKNMLLKRIKVDLKSADLRELFKIIIKHNFELLR